MTCCINVVATLAARMPREYQEEFRALLLFRCLVSFDMALPNELPELLKPMRAKLKA